MPRHSFYVYLTNAMNRASCLFCCKKAAEWVDWFLHRPINICSPDPAFPPKLGFELNQRFHPPQEVRHLGYFHLCLSPSSIVNTPWSSTLPSSSSSTWYWQCSPCLSYIWADHDDDPDHDHHHHPHDADNVPPVCPIFGLTHRFNPPTPPPPPSTQLHFAQINTNKWILCIDQVL